MSLRFAVLVLIALCAPGPTAAASERWINGRVQADRDGDGRADRGASGIEGVKLSNGREVVRTGSDGRYRIALRDGDTLLLIKPPQWRARVRDDGLPDTWQHELRTPSRDLRFGGRSRARADGRFVLQPAPARAPDDAWRIRVFGDPQPRNAEQVGFFRDDIVAPLVGEPADLGISLGDIVDDDLALYPQMKSVMASLGTPWIHVPGNHDLDFDAADDRGSLDTFRQHYGADSVAWEEPGLSVIGLDNVLYDPAQRAYRGGLRADQFDFLAAYLETLPNAQRVVLAIHIPLFDKFDPEHRARLFALLSRFAGPLVLSGHSHIQQHVFHGPDSGWSGAEPLHEYNVGASCGGYWGGPADAAGIPDARMADGTPNGHALLSIQPDGALRLSWHAARDPENPAMHLHAPKVLRRGAYPGVPVIANVYMADADSVVELRIDAGPWQPMERIEGKDPWLVAQNLAADASLQLRSFNRLVQAGDSPHLFGFNLPTDLALGEHEIEVRTIDRWRGELRASTAYQLVDWP